MNCPRPLCQRRLRLLPDIDGNTYWCVVHGDIQPRRDPTPLERGDVKRRREPQTVNSKQYTGKWWR